MLKELLAKSKYMDINGHCAVSAMMSLGQTGSAAGGFVCDEDGDERRFDAGRDDGLARPPRAWNCRCSRTSAARPGGKVYEKRERRAEAIGPLAWSGDQNLMFGVKI